MKNKIIILSLSIFLLVFSGFTTVQSQTKEITLNDIYAGGEFYSKRVYGIRSMADGNHYSVLQNDSINIFKYKDGKYVKTILTASELIPEGQEENIQLRRYTFSKDESKILIPTKTEYIYRHSSQSDFYIWNIKDKTLQQLSTNGKQRLADFSPDGTKVIFIRDNNLFIKNLINNTEKQITDDGLYNNIINGTTDWVYEEEFSFTKAFFWSPDGKKIAFYKFDESDVKEFFFSKYGNLYPEEYKYKYPKAGEANSIVNIYTYDIESENIVKMDIGEETDQYIPRIKWTKNPDILSILKMNRLQNKLEILFANPYNGISEVIYTETNKYYIDITDHLIFLNDNEHFLFTSEKDGYYHIYLYNMNGELVKQLTKGKWVITDLIGFDENKKLVYYISAESSPLNRDVYCVNLKGNKTKLSSRKGTNSARFSSNYNYYINTFSDANTPPVITVNKTNGKQLRVLEDNSKLLETIKEYNFSNKEFFTIITSEDIKLNAWKILPPDFDNTKEYPVLFTIYGGPGSQTVQNSWGRGNLWEQMLAQKGIIVVSVDNRGTGARGEEFKKMTYLQLGKYETIDQIEAAKYLSSLDYVDANKIGIFGWSYGGYMAALCMTKGAEYFNTGIAVAPVTNWRYYDNIYTERFMRTPQENPDGYDDNSPINHVDKLKGNFLLIHGTADDNVHIQNSIDLVTALVAANKQFEMQFYPNSNHGIYTGRNTRMHLYTKMTEFLIKNLKQ
ncbi:MAG: S9 family peptidase [Bacteroidales bacterium]|nr:S9 family peptidase [Bacteroidales bacterium]